MASDRRAGRRAEESHMKSTWLKWTWGAIAALVALSFMAELLPR
jgi:hypothetical protein